MVKVTQQQVAEPELQRHLLAPEQAPCAQELQGGVARLSHLMTTSLRDPRAAWATKDADTSVPLPQMTIQAPPSGLSTLSSTLTPS